MDKSAKFWDRIAKRYAGKPIADEAAYQKKLTGHARVSSTSYGDS
jgi:hypothetical protein